MSEPLPEFSRLVPLARLGTEPFRQEIAATAAECEALARRFELSSLDRLIAMVELTRERGGTILLRAEFTAEFVQECIVTLEPVAGSLGETFTLRYGPPEAEPDEMIASDDEEPAFQPLDGEAIDVGEAVAQEFSLALSPFPRRADATVESGVGETAATESPFAALGGLIRPHGN
jgi:uncharacterized metal-binding protein YceD (DUF177 family)